MNRRSALSSPVLRSIRFICLIVMVLALSLTSAPLTQVQAAAGDLDPTFSNDGKVTTDFFGFGDDAFAVTVLPGGKILAAGSATSLSTSFDFAVALYNSNGSLDAAFGSGGKVTTDFFGSFDFITAVAVQPDGKIVVGGTAFHDAVDSDFAMARFNSNGSLDTTFGSGGKVTTDFGGTQDQALGIALQPNGKIVLVGYRLQFDPFARDFALAQYNSNGSLDTTFGTGGKVTTDFLGGDDQAHDVVTQPDGRIVAAGVGSQPGISILVRYNSDGSLDSTFGSGGVATGFPNGPARALAVQSDGKFVIAGEALVNNSLDFALARFNADGSLDATFGSGGIVTADLGGEEMPLDVAVQPDGHIVAVGEQDINLRANFVVARFNSSGALDASFGSGGKVITDFGVDCFAQGVAIQSDGKIIASGRVNGLDEADFALARYQVANFDACLQDDSNGNLLQVNLTTGDYQFSVCRKNFTITGRGTVRVRGCKTEFHAIESGRNITALINTCSNVANATVQAQGRTFTIVDTNLTNNTCSCQ